MFPSDKIDNTTAAVRNGTLTVAELLDHLDHTRAIEDTLDTAVAGAYGTAAARFAALEATLATLGRAARINLRVVNNASSPNSKVDLSADFLAVEGSGLSTVTVSTDLTVDGKNGYDNLGADAEDASTWYHLWVGYKPSTDERCGLFSKSTTRAGLVLSHASLAGFTRFQYYSSWYNDGSSNLRRAEQLGDRLRYVNQEVWSVSNAAATSGTWNTGTFDTMVPPGVARCADLLCRVNVGSNATLLSLRPKDETSAAGFGVFERPASGGDVRAIVPNMRLDTSARVEWKTNQTLANGVYLAVLGFVVPL